MRAFYSFPGLDQRGAANELFTLLLAVICGVCMVSSPAIAGPPDSMDFFEAKIRPVLVKHCYECHSSDSEDIGGNLWLDSAGGMLVGGESGPAIVPGDANGSVLISALKYESAEMPPDQPLPDQVIADFEKWINAGAADPRKGMPRKRDAAEEEIDIEAGRQFWAFQPPRDFRTKLSPAQRESISSRWIDFQIEESLADAGVAANPVASPAARLRRLAFDLTGLPPEEDLQRRWLADPSEERWAAIVDELLASRAFALHWARHWMDVARYADSNGSDFNATFHEAWRYRDYLIDSFHTDRPVDELIRQQVAGDLLKADSDGQRYDNVVATTFLMLGPKMLSERNKAKLSLDVVDEQIDTIGRAFLGLTLGCARCHDHKFDPIATEDYYALAGIFKSTQTLNGESQKYVSTWNRVDLPMRAEQAEAIKRYKSESGRLKKEIDAATKAYDEVRKQGEAGIIVDDSEATKVGKWVRSTYSKDFIGDGYVHDDNSQKGKASITFTTRLEHDGEYVLRVAYSASGNRAKTIPVTVTTADGVRELTLDQTKKSDSVPWFAIGTFSFSSQQDVVLTMKNDGTKGYVIADAIQFLPVGDAARLTPDQKKIEQEIADAKAKLDTLKEQLKTLEGNAPPPPPVAMAPRDFSGDKIADSSVHIRGEVKNLGETVPRGFLRVCSPGDAAIREPVGSGRVELARWLTDPDNPLVARVLVNRVFSHLFGEGIVRSVDNFGSRGQLPSHPELLDALAIDFTRNGWQLKSLIRTLVLSDAYSRSSGYDDDSAAIDPENRLLWRANRKRIPAEAIRDTMIWATGRLSAEEPIAPVADKGVLVSKNNGDSKATGLDLTRSVRTIFLPIVRSNVPPLLAALDAADPDLLVGKRPTTNVPAQALVLLNSREVNLWASQTAERLVANERDSEQLIRNAYRLCLSREPTSAELRMIREQLGELATGDETQRIDRMTDLVASIFASVEFRLLN